jgi:DNA adenine methylase
MRNGRLPETVTKAERNGHLREGKNMTYYGGKNGSGVYQKIISLMPKHRLYAEPFLGHGAILRNKKEAEFNFGVEPDLSLSSFWIDFLIKEKRKNHFDIRIESAFDFFLYLEK